MESTLRYAKMRALSRRGLVDEFRIGGFRITDKGVEFLYPGYCETQYQKTRSSGSSNSARWLSGCAPVDAIC
jgi:repressor of nif and glnA expression